FATSAEAGRLASQRPPADRPGVDWWLGPALLGPPMMPVGPGAESADAPSTSDQEDPTTVVECAPEPPSAQLATVLEENIDERTVLSMPYAQADTVSLRDADAERLAEVVRAHGEQAWEDAGIVPRAAAQRIDGPTADAGTLDSVLA